MLPNDSWSSTPQPSELLPPHDSDRIDPLVAQDMGPIAVNDVTQGLRARLWTATCDGSSVTLDGHGALFSDTAITQISLTFDQAGKPFVAYAAGGMVKIWWFDPIAGDNVTTEIATGDQPFAHLDERRPELVSISDVIIVYRSAGALRYRKQRDRFLVEHSTPISSASQLSIQAFGMSTGGRLQVKYSAKGFVSNETAPPPEPTIDTVYAVTCGVYAAGRRDFRLSLSSELSPPIEPYGMRVCFASFGPVPGGYVNLYELSGPAGTIWVDALPGNAIRVAAGIDRGSQAILYSSAGAALYVGRATGLSVDALGGVLRIQGQVDGSFSNIGWSSSGNAQVAAILADIQTIKIGPDFSAAAGGSAELMWIGLREPQSSTDADWPARSYSGRWVMRSPGPMLYESELAAVATPEPIVSTETGSPDAAAWREVDYFQF